MLFYIGFDRNNSHSIIIVHYSCCLQTVRKNNNKNNLHKHTHTIQYKYTHNTDISNTRSNLCTFEYNIDKGNISKKK